MNTELDPKRARRRLRLFLRSKANELLWELPASTKLDRALAVYAEDGDLAVNVSLNIVDRKSADGVSISNTGGIFFSPIEAAVINALLAARSVEGSDRHLSGKQLASACGQQYKTQFKYIVKNLIDREVLQYTPAKGYQVSIRKPGQPQSTKGNNDGGD
jgi:hypothetical protein